MKLHFVGPFCVKMPIARLQQLYGAAFGDPDGPLQFFLPNDLDAIQLRIDRMLTVRGGDQTS